jgi:hypothetical protein
VDAGRAGLTEGTKHMAHRSGGVHALLHRSVMDKAAQRVHSQQDRAGSRKTLALMASDGSDKSPHGGPAPTSRRRAAAKSTPEWADGLKQLYDAVVEEDLPDQFLDLLAQLDQQEMPPQGRGGGSSSSGQGDAR